MEQFILEKYLENPSRKVVTRDGRIVEILKLDAKGNHPIIGVYQFSDTEDMESSWRIDGKKTENEESSFDLFFADEEKKLTDFEEGLNCFLRDWIQRKDDYRTVEEATKESSKKLLDLARKELEKSNPCSGNQKQEWSEEDKHCVELLLPIIDSSSLIPKNRKKCKNFLQSLKPQSHWKPSEEQMNALDKAKNSPANYYDIRLGLQSLYNDLLKL